jgi:hypothetical protein
VKGTTKQGKINDQKNIYHQKDIIEQYGQLNMASK